MASLTSDPKPQARRVILRRFGPGSTNNKHDLRYLPAFDLEVLRRMRARKRVLVVSTVVRCVLSYGQFNVTRTANEVERVGQHGSRDGDIWQYQLSRLGVVVS